MNDWKTLTKNDLEQLQAELQQRYDAMKARGLALDMTRGKPSPEQLDLANDMLTLPGPDDYKTANGTDARNYGGVDGIPEAKALFAEYMGVSPDEIIIGGNASLTIMHDCVVRALTHGVPVRDANGNLSTSKPWIQGKPKFLCPVPGYDRHFAVCAHFGIEMIPVPLNDDGPDMNEVERLAGADADIKGIWCVPKYSNPTGIVYSDAAVDRFASMKTAAPDFRIVWDNAYAEHHLGDGPAPLKNLLDACKDAGNGERVWMIGSTSKISFAGAGLAFLAASEANIADAKQHLAIQTIGPDKVNQLRHIRFFGDMNGLRAHMDKHALILKPKFDTVLNIFETQLSGADIAEWTRPEGGYFISLDTMPGCASEVVRLAGEAGVKLTKAGATFPYGKDPEDRNIRIAPSLPSVEEITAAMEVVAVCVKLVSAQKLLP